MEVHEPLLQQHPPMQIQEGEAEEQAKLFDCFFECTCKINCNTSNPRNLERAWSCLTHSTHFKYALITTITLTALGCVVVPTPFLTSIIKEYSTVCLKELDGPWNELLSCQKPYIPKIKALEFVIAGGTIVLGYLFQTACEPSDEQEFLKDTEFRLKNLPTLAKKAVIYFQSKFNYETQVFLGYFYNGFWLNTETKESWITYFQMQAGAIGIAGAFFGMFIRMQYTAFWENRPLEEARQRGQGNLLSKKNLPLFGILFVCGILVGFSYCSIQEELLGRNADYIIRDLGILALGRYAWKFSLKKTFKVLDKLTSPKQVKIANFVKGFLKYTPPLVVAGGYFIYIKSPQDLYKPLGMLTMGVGVGGRSFKNEMDAKDIDWKPTWIDNPSPEKAKKIQQNLKRAIAVSWKGISALTFGVLLAKYQFLNCYNVEQLDCPVSFEFSKNYVNLSSSGVSDFVFTALGAYYLARTLRFAELKSKGKAKSVVRTINRIKFDYQFDLLSLIPYAIIQSGTYISSYDDFATYDAIAPTILLGLTYGFYREKTGALGEDPNRPIFSDTAILAALI